MKRRAVVVDQEHANHRPRLRLTTIARFSRGSGLLFASLTLAACSSGRSKEGDCWIGEAGCTCTQFGGCDPGLECAPDGAWERVCVEPQGSEAEWIPLGDSGTANDTIASHDVAKDFHDLLVVDRQMFFTYREEQMIRVLDLDDGFVTEIPVDGFAETIAADGSVGTVVVTIAPGHDGALQDHGQLVLIDPSSLSWDVVAIPIIPGDVVTNGAGTAFVSIQSPSGFDYSVIAMDLAAGTFVRYFGDDYYESRNLAMHPLGDRIYAMRTNSNPAHLIRWNVEGDVLTDTRVSDASFDWNRMALGPSGDTAYLIDGTTLTLSNDPSVDMDVTGALTPDGRWDDIAFDPTGERAYTIPTQGLGIRIYDTKSAKQIGDYRSTVDHSIYRIAAGPTSLFVAEASRFEPSTMMRIDEVAFP